jgi:arylsulfatase A-like enzyme
MIRHPEGVGRGKRIKAFVDSTDLMPTILDFLKVIGPNAKDTAFEGTKFIPGASPDEIEGQSLLPLMSGEKEKIRDFVVSGNFNLSYRIRDENWSFYMWAPEEFSNRSGPELYKIDDDFKVPEPTKFNRKGDWMERENMIHRYPEVAERMELNLRRFLDEFSEKGETSYTGRTAVGYFWSPRK